MMVLHTKTMRREWKGIPRGICSLPLTCRRELAEHFSKMREQGLVILVREVRISQAVKMHSGRLAREWGIKRAVEDIEDKLREQRLRLLSETVAISRVKEGFIVWALGMKPRQLPERR